MATSALPLLVLLLLAATASARPCKTLFYFTTTTTFYPVSENPNPNSNPNSIYRNPRFVTFFFTTRFPEHHRIYRFSRNPISTLALNDESESSSAASSSSVPIRFYSSVSSSIRDRTKDIMSVVGALMFGVGCGALTAATMYLIWSLFFPNRFEYDDHSDGDDDDDYGSGAPKKMGYVAIPTKPKMVDQIDDDLKKPATPAKEVV